MVYTFAKYIDEIFQYPVLTREQELEIGRENRAGNQEARDTLITSNLRWVISVVKPYAKDNDEDLLRLSLEGNPGLISAAERYDEQRARFTTFSSWHIKNTIFEYFNHQGRIVRMPQKTSQLYRQIKDFVECFLTLYERLPTPEEIHAASLTRNPSVSRIEQVSEAGNTPILSFDKETTDECPLYDEVYLHDGREIWEKLSVESLQQVVEAAINRFDKSHIKEGLRMSILEGKSRKQIAQAQGITPSGVRMKLPPAERELARRLRNDPAFIELGYVFK